MTKLRLFLELLHARFQLVGEAHRTDYDAPFVSVSKTSQPLNKYEGKSTLWRADRANDSETACICGETMLWAEG